MAYEDRKFAFLKHTFLGGAISDLLHTCYTSELHCIAPAWRSIKWGEIQPGHVETYANVIYPTVDSACSNSPYLLASA